VINHQAALPNVYDQFEDDPDAFESRAFADDDLRERVATVGRRVVEAVHSKRVTV